MDQIKDDQCGFFLTSKYLFLNHFNAKLPITIEIKRIFLSHAQIKINLRANMTFPFESRNYEDEYV